MARGNATLTNVVGGELSAFMDGRSDLDVVQKGLEWCQNWIIHPQGGASYRPGNKMLGLTKNNSVGGLVPFQFSANDAYMMVFTDSKLRFYRNEGAVLNADKTITGITKANPAVVTSNAHGYANGDEVFISTVEGMSQVNGRFFKVASAAANTFALQDQFGNNVNSTNYGTYTSGGTAASIFELATPYTSGFDALRQAQSADLMYIVGPGYEPRKLTRTGHTAWTIGTYVRAADPFSVTSKYPTVIGFSKDSRLCYASTPDNPEGWFASQPPVNVTLGYDSFVITTTAVSSLSINLAPAANTIDKIQEMVQFGKQMVLLGDSSIRRLYGADQDSPPALDHINADPVFEGSAKVRPLVIGGALLFIDVSGKKMKELRFDLSQEAYEAKNLNLIADHLGEVSFKRMVRVKGSPETIWVLRSDGLLLSYAYNNSENIAGWARHVMGGGGAVEDIATLRRDTGEDQLYMIVKRTVGGVVYRSIEVMSALPTFVRKRSFFTGNKTADLLKWSNVNWEVQKSANFLDMSSSYDGRARGILKNATITPGATTGNGITVTSSASVFTSAHVGAYIRKRYAADGSGGGIAKITAVVSGTQATCDMLVDFDNVIAIAPGNWELTTNTISNLHLYEGQTINIVADGNVHRDLTVASGAITLDFQAGQITVGFKYVGLLATHNLDMGSPTGPANSKPRNITKIKPRLKDTSSCKIGPDEYRTRQLNFRQADHIAGRPTPPFSGVLEDTPLDLWTPTSKNVVVVQDLPQPCTLLSIDVEMETVA